MSRRLAVSLLSLVLLLACAGSATAGTTTTGTTTTPTPTALSAYPLKAAGDTGIVQKTQLSPASYVYWGSLGSLYIRGFDACTYISPYVNGFPNTYQEDNVGNCVPIQSPWIRLAPLKTQGWAIYCPSYAPNSWVLSNGGALQQWTSDQDVESMNFNPKDNSFGPSPVAKNDYYTTNWGDSHHFWLFTVGCSPQAWQNIANDGGTYCCGQGTSAIPNFHRNLADRRGGPGTVPAGTALMAKGPAYDRRELVPGYYTLARELDLRPSRTTKLTLRCDAGYRLHRPRDGVGYYTTHLPTNRDGLVRDTIRQRVRAATLTARTDKNVKRGTVRVQFQASCSKPGVRVR